MLIFIVYGRPTRPCVVEMQNAPAGMFDNEEAVQGTEIMVGDGKEVEGGNDFTMVDQKSVRLTGFAFIRNAPQLLQITRHGRFRDVGSGAV